MNEAVASVVVRAARLADLNAILQIQALCYTELEPESAESMGAKLQAAPQSCFVAEYQGQVVGYLLSLPWILHQLPALDSQTCQLPDQPDCFYLHDLAVAPAGRGLGVAQQLVQAFFAALAQSRLQAACLIAVQDSGAFWQRWGFQHLQADAALQLKLDSYGPGVEYRVWQGAADDETPSPVSIPAVH